MGIDYPPNTRTSAIALLNATYEQHLDLSNVELEFPGYDKDLIIESQMYYESRKNKVLFAIQTTLDFTQISKPISFAIKILAGKFNKADSLLKLWFKSEIEKNNFTMAINQLNAQLDAVSSRLERMSNTNLSLEDRKFEIVPALHNLESMLNLFKNQNDFYYKNPLLMTPSLISIAQVYIETASIAPSLIESYRDDLQTKMTNLKQTLEDYKDNFITQRMGKIQFEMSRLSSSDFLIVKDHFVRCQRTIRHKGWMQYLNPFSSLIPSRLGPVIPGPFLGVVVLYDNVRGMAHDFSPEAIQIGEEYKNRVRQIYSDYFDPTIARFG